MTVVYEYPEQRRKVLTASGESMSREDAEALGYTIATYADLVAPAARIATRHPEHSDLVALPPFGLAVQPGTAKAMGFTVSSIRAAPRAAITPSRPDPRAAWRSSIFALSEARERPAATAELLTSQTPETFTVDQARVFLRGLSVETEHTEETTMTTDTDPRAARLAEISNSMTAFNRNNGYKTKAPQPALNDIEPAKLKRLAEIRLAAMDASGRGRSQDAKSLRLALSTHESVGTPLGRLFEQLGVDASKIIPAI